MSLNLIKYLHIFLLAGLLALPAAAQQAADDPEDTGAAETAGDATADEAPPDEATADDADVDLDDPADADLDEQTYEEDEDDFIPTEEIPADEPIPFPSNI